jgi:hypothetical protein
MRSSLAIDKENGDVDVDSTVLDDDDEDDDADDDDDTVLDA